MLLTKILLALATLHLAICYFDERLTPKYHFVSVWAMMDPNGPMYYNGKYHLFFQHNPKGISWGANGWGHAVSEDMIKWTHLPLALKPDQWYDVDSCWSGSAIMSPEGIPTLFYTGGGPNNEQRICSATPRNLSDPYLVEWKKNDLNPLIDMDQQVVDGHRDPTTPWIASDGLYHMLVGVHMINESGNAFVYQSPDLVHWTWEHPFFKIVDSQIWAPPGLTLECPDFFEIDGQYVFKFSHTDMDWYAFGDYDDATRTFVHTWGMQLDYGDAAFYASKSFWDTNKSRRVHIGWLHEEDNSDWTVRGWSGVQSIPRIVSIGSSGRLQFTPIPEFEAYRGTHTQLGITNLLNTVMTLPVGGAELDMTFTISNFSSAETFGFRIATNEQNSTEAVTITFYQEYITPAKYFPDGFPYLNLSVTNWSDCQKACNEDGYCFAWSFLPDIQTCMLNAEGFYITPTQYPEAMSGGKARILFDRVSMSSNDTVGWPAVNCALWPADEQELLVRIIIDHSVLETFVNYEFNTGIRIYPSPAPSKWIHQIFAYGKHNVTFQADIWELQMV